MGILLDILSINIKCDYYKNCTSDDIEISPTIDTEKLFKRYPLTFVKVKNYYKIILLAKNISDPEKSYKSIFNNKTMEFNLFVKNKNMYNFCKIDVNKKYLFENKNDDKELKIDDNNMLIDNNVYQEKLFGKIILDLNKLTYDGKNNLFINIPTIKSYWVLNSDYIDFSKIKFNFKLNDKPVIFNIYENNNQLISEDLIELKEQEQYKLILTIKDKSTSKDIYIPTPTIYDKIIDSKYISLLYFNKTQ